MVLHAISWKNASLHHCIIFHHKMMKMHHCITLHVIKYYLQAVYLLIFICAWLHIDLIVSSQGICHIYWIVRPIDLIVSSQGICHIYWIVRPIAGQVKFLLGLIKSTSKFLEILLRAVIWHDYMYLLIIVSCLFICLLICRGNCTVLVLDIRCYESMVEIFVSFCLLMLCGITSEYWTLCTGKCGEFCRKRH